MSATHHRRGSARAALPRRSTKGPLDVDDPLSSSSLSVSPSRQPSLSPTPSSDLARSQTQATTQLLSEVDDPPQATGSVKDLGFLLDASIYHPLSTIDTPPPFRRPFVPSPPTGTPLNRVFSDLSKLLGQCQFLQAAQLAANVLTSGIVQPTDTDAIFRLLSIRYSSLELSGNLLLAAQEAKALEDLSSSFYWVGDASKTTDDRAGDASPLQEHIMPFDLRLQALRLQGIGFGDSRRTVGALFDLGMECRHHLRLANEKERSLWGDRLEEVGVRVVNSLIDMGDLDSAKRTLWSMQTDQSRNKATWTARMVLLLIKMGEINEARQLVEASDNNIETSIILSTFIDIADGDFESATQKLVRANDHRTGQATIAIAKHNLAVAYLYIGEIDKSRELLESLIDEDNSFQTLTINLATIYDLTSDKSKDMKTELAARIANSKADVPQRGFINADFKL